MYLKKSQFFFSLTSTHLHIGINTKAKVTDHRPIPGKLSKEEREEGWCLVGIERGDGVASRTRGHGWDSKRGKIEKGNTG